MTLDFEYVTRGAVVVLIAGCIVALPTIAAASLAYRATGAAVEYAEAIPTLMLCMARHAAKVATGED